MSLPDKSTTEATPCSGCLDLRPELYRRLRDGRHFLFEDFASLEHLDLHYYISSFSRIEKMSKEGCKFCSILDQGMRHFWNLEEIAQSISHKSSDGVDFDEEIEYSSSSGNDVDDFYRPCIEIRPRRGLVVSVIHVRDDIFKVEILNKNRSNFFDHRDHFGRVKAPLEFYSISGHNNTFSAFGRSANIPADLTADRCGRFLNEWLQECSVRHEDCPPKLNAGCPKRLIQVSGSSIRLIDAGPEFKQYYTTLSHRWGAKDVASGMLKTTRSNLKNLQKSICWDRLPRTFQDAITVTRLVSCNYLWIDSLCIVQKDEEGDDDQDWKEQAPQMSSIYANSYLNIAATASHDGRGGLMFPRFSLNEDITSPDRMPVDSVELSHGVAVRPDLEHIHSIFFEEKTMGLKKADLSPLLTRAWVFQEQLLPGRTVHFTCSEMVWECRGHTVCECGGLNDWGRQYENSKTSFNDCVAGNAESRAIFESWRRFVSAYTELEMTHHEDWPFAIAGIASRLQPRMKGRYLAGLWEADFPADLMWWSRYHSTPKLLKEDHWELSEDTPPTWSWLRCIRSLKSKKISSRIYYVRTSDEWDMIRDSRFAFNFTDVTDGLNTEGSLMYLTNVRLQLRGAVVKGLASFDADYHRAAGKYLHIRFSGISRSLYFDADFPLPTTFRQSDFEVFCLFVGVYREKLRNGLGDLERGLVLSDFCSGGSFLIRIGLFSWDVLGLFNEAEVREIELR